MEKEYTIKFCEQMANGVKAIADVRPLFQKLADTMREIERLRTALDEIEYSTYEIATQSKAFKALQPTQNREK